MRGAGVATIAVRPHFFAGFALLAASAILGVLTAAGKGPFDADAHLIAYLGGLTLFAQGIAFWYLPSFAKRSVVLDGMADYAGPLLFPAAAIGALVRSAQLRGTMLALGLVLFAIVVLASAAFGPRWRSGIPFWKHDGPFRSGDLAAALTHAAASLSFAAAGIAALLAPAALILAWPMALALFVIAHIAHLAPRGRGRPLLVAPFAIGILAATVGATLLALARAGVVNAIPSRLSIVLLAGFALAGVGIAAPPRTKGRGPRTREAGPLLAAAIGLLLLGIVGAAAWPTLTFGRAMSAYSALMAALGLAMAGLGMLTMPVLFNQRPAGSLLLPALLCALAAATLLAASFVVTLPRWPTALALAMALLLWLAALAPLRTPRRQS